MATGIARGAHDRGKKIAFGDRLSIKWDQHSRTIFAGNPNVAEPGTERQKNIEWVPFYKGHRTYNVHDVENNRWVWNYEFRAIPGELYFSADETKAASRAGEGFVVIEPEVARWKSSSINKDWGRERYQAVATELSRSRRVVQFLHSRSLPLRDVEVMPTLSFRDALAMMMRASLFVGPEGGLHHGAAAVGTPAVVLFGGFIPPQVTGYETHTNLTGGAEACGSLSPCAHCRRAMEAISVDEVVSAAEERLKVAA